jgi:hypothetical protein
MSEAMLSSGYEKAPAADREGSSSTGGAPPDRLSRIGYWASGLVLVVVDFSMVVVVWTGTTGATA